MGPECCGLKAQGIVQPRGGRAVGGPLVGKEAFTFSDPRTLQMANVGLLLFLLSPHSCLRPAVAGVLTAFR